MDGSVVLILAIAAAAFALMGYFWWWCYRAWSRIWSAPQNAFENIVFRQGARGWGLMMWLALAILFPLHDALRAHHSMKRIAIQIGIGAVLGFPMYLWFGYWWGRGMAAFFGVKDSARAV